MVGKPRQQMTVDERPIGMKAVVHDTITVEIDGTVDRERQA